MSQIHFLRMLLHNLHSAHDVPSYLLHPDSSKKLLVRKLSLEGLTLDIFLTFSRGQREKEGVSESHRLHVFGLGKTVS